MGKSDGFVLVNEHFNIIEYSPIVQELSGYSDKEISSFNLYDLIDDNEVFKVMNEQAARKKGQEGCYNVRVLKKDSTPVKILIQSTPIMDGEQFKGARIEFWIPDESKDT